MKSFLPLFAFIIGATAMAQTYTNAESVERDQVNNRWLVANGSNIIIDDGNGNLSFFGNASATHGMEVVGDVLFAIDSNVIKGYMLDDASEVMSLTIPGVGFLNGMGSDTNNDILYISDFGNNKIYSVDVSDINNPSFVEIVSDTGGIPNGVLYDGEESNRLLFVTWGNNAKIKQVDLTDFSVSDVVSDTGVGNIDGIVKGFLDQYYISSWSPPKIIEYNSNFGIAYDYITGGINNPADLDISFDMIGIPIGNDVIFEFVPWEIGVEEFNFSEINFKLSENPISVNSYIEFALDQPSQMNIDLFNIEGKKVASVLNNSQVNGYNQVFLPFAKLETGTYFLNITMDSKKQIMKLLVR